MGQSAHSSSLYSTKLILHWKLKKPSLFARKLMSSFRKTIHDSPVSDSRKRQSKKDEAIRRKIEHELSKKRGQPTKLSKRRKAAPGTVMSLNPSDPIICKTSATVFEVAQLMSAKKENCILVVDDGGHLIGIFTAKDLAFRIVGSGLNASTVSIDQIMTPSPICTKASDPASEALTLMVERGFRHLPVLDDDDHIVGVLDITKSYAKQMEKLERLHSSSRKLYEALDSVHSEMGVADQPRHVFEYFEDLKSKMDGPTLLSVLDGSTTPVYTSVKSSVYDATILMKENRTTAVLVRDSKETVTGIFTSKDVVLRVIAAGLDPRKCSVVRVMTPNPDVASATTSIQEALRRMFEGHYLNLPVVDDENEIVGIVDVLKLTYATLNQIQRIELNPQEPKAKEEGPAWNKFWTSLDNDDNDSTHSDSIASVPDVTPSEFHLFDIGPQDSISAVGESISSRQPTKTMSNMSDQLAVFTFKFKSPAIQGRVHRVTLKPHESLEDLRLVISEKLHFKDLEILQATKDGDGAYAISYVDDEGDVVSITSDNDLRDCIRINQEMEKNKADLYLHNPHEHAPVRNIVKNSESHNSGDIIPGVSNQLLISGALGVASLLAAALIVTKRK